MTEDLIRAQGYLALGTRLKRIGERLQAQTQEILTASGIDLPVAQSPVLAVIDRLGPVSIGEVTEALGVAQPGVTRTVGKLESAGLVRLARESGDRRVSLVTLTPMGRRLVARWKREVWPRIEAAVADACDGLSGPLLDQLTGLEEALSQAALQDRAVRMRKEGRKNAHA